MSRRVLVTGGAGFIGGHVCDALIAAGDHVVVLDDLSGGVREHVPPGAELIIGNIRDPAVVDRAVAGVDAVLHIAGQASIRLSFNDPAADLGVNTLGTIHVLQSCLKYRVPRLIFASSMTIYGTGAPVPTPETTPPNPVSYYAITKYAAERYVLATAWRKDLPAPLNVTALRMFNVYGARQSLTNPYQGVFAIFIGNVLRGEPITIHAGGAQSRDFVHVSDVARAWVDAINTPATHGQVINLGGGRETSVNHVCDIVLDAFGHTRATYPVIAGDAQPGDLQRSAADITKARELLAWSPRVSVEAGMAATIAWAKAHR